MYIQILSVSKKTETDTLPEQTDKLRSELYNYGYSLTEIKKTLLTPATINSALNSIAKSSNKPDMVIIANALDTKDSKSFKKYFVETVVAAERAESFRRIFPAVRNGQGALDAARQHTLRFPAQRPQAVAADEAGTLVYGSLIGGSGWGDDTPYGIYSFPAASGSPV